MYNRHLIEATSGALSCSQPVIDVSSRKVDIGSRTRTLQVDEQWDRVDDIAVRYVLWKIL